MKTPFGEISLINSHRLIREFQIPYKMHKKTKKDLEAHVWDGQRFNFPIDLSGEDVLHEVCHWLVAKPELKHLPNFGLGQAVFGKKSERVLVYSKTEEQEALTCFLSILTYKSLGLRWGSLAENLGFEANVTWEVAQHHSTPWGLFMDQYDSYLVDLDNLGLLNSENEPTFVPYLRRASILRGNHDRTTVRGDTVDTRH